MERGAFSLASDLQAISPSPLSVASRKANAARASESSGRQQRGSEQLTLDESLHLPVLPQTALSPMSACVRCWLEFALDGDTEQMQQMLSELSGVDRVELLNAADDHQRTALFLCIMRDDQRSLRWLLEQNADVNLRDRWKQTPLIKAIINGCTACAQMLVAAGADLALVDGDDRHAFLWACEFDELECVRWIWKQATHNPPRAIAFDVRSSDLAMTPLMTACQQGSLAVAQFLVHEARVDLEAEDSGGKTAMIHAAMSGNLHCMRVLLEAGAQVEHADAEGDTPLIWAAWQGQEDCLRHLIVNARARINHQNNSGLTGLMNAVRWEHAACVRLLLDHHADAALVSHAGSTAWSLAVCMENADPTVIEWLSDAAQQREQRREATSSSSSSIAASSVPASLSSSAVSASSPSLAQSCFQDGLCSIFEMLSLPECTIVVPLVCTHWRSVWTGCLQKGRLPLHLHVRSSEVLIRALRSPLLPHLRGISTYSVGNPVRGLCHLRTSDLAQLAARAPHLTQLTAHLLLPADLLDSSEDDEDAPPALALGDDVDLAALAAQPFDLYGAGDEDTFRFPVCLASLQLEVSAVDGESFDNAARLFLQLSRLPLIHTLSLCVPPEACAESADFLTLVLRPPLLRSLALYGPPRRYIPITPRDVWSIVHKPALESLSFNQGESGEAVASVYAAIPTLRLPNLQWFDLSRVVLDDTHSLLCAMMPALQRLSPASWRHTRAWQLLTTLPQIRTLHLHLRAEATPQAVPAADIAPLALLTHLTSLSLKHVDLAHFNDTPDAFAAALRSIPLRSLTFAHSRLPAGTIAMLAESAPGLEQLSFSKCTLAGARPVDPVELLRPLSRLPVLRVLRCLHSLTDASPDLIAAFAYPSRLLPQLHTLSWQPPHASLEWNHASEELEAASVERWSTA